MAYADPLDERGRESRRKHYRANKAQYVRRAQEREREMKAWLREQKTDKACMDCGVVYPSYVMDFDHRDPALKVGEVNQVIKRGSWQALRDEVAKCDLVCANCHRIRTWAPRRGEAEVAERSPKPLPTAFDSLHPCSKSGGPPPAIDP